MTTQKAHMIKAYNIISLKSGHKDVRKLRRDGFTPSIHGNKVWSSCFALMEFLEQNPLPIESKVIEVGCGWGALSCYIKKRQKSYVIATDADPSIEAFFNLTCSVNNVTIPFKKLKIEQLDSRLIKKYDTLIGSDICFWDEMTNSLYKLIKRAIKNGMERVYIADPGRQPFWNLVEKCNGNFKTDIHRIRSKALKSAEKNILVINQ